MTDPHVQPGDPIAPDVARASEGDRAALERVFVAIGPDVHRLALRFFGCPQDAEDATQEALLHLLTRLDRFRGESAFRTWVYRVATNKFLTMARSRAERAAMSFEEFERDLAVLPAAGLAHAPPLDVEEALLMEEVKIGCTLAMLLCLDRAHRLAYILGEIMGLDHRTGAEVLEVSPAAFRKRVQRARERITGLMRSRCGLFDPANACRCARRVPVAIELGRVDPRHLAFARSAAQATSFPDVLDEIRRLGEADRAAALYRSHPDPPSDYDFVAYVRGLLEAWGGGTVVRPAGRADRSPPS